MKYFLLVVGIIGLVCCLILFVSHIMDGDFTGAVAWLFGVTANALSVVINGALIKEEV